MEWNASTKNAYFYKKQCIKCIKIKIYLHNMHKRRIVMHKQQKSVIYIGKDSDFVTFFCCL